MTTTNFTDTTHDPAVRGYLHQPDSPAVASIHPPKQPEKMRTQHLPKLYTPTMFVSGTKDPFGTTAEIDAARKLIRAKTHLVTIEGVGHDLGVNTKKGGSELPAIVCEHFLRFFM